MAKKHKVSPTETFTKEWLENAVKNLREKFITSKKLDETDTTALFNIIEIVMSQNDEFTQEYTERLNEKNLIVNETFEEDYIDEEDEDEIS
jgi:hypothetical protein